MAIDFLYPQYEVVRNYDRCICCRACERQCANEVHFYDPEFQKMQVDARSASLPPSWIRSGRPAAARLSL